LLKFIHEWVNKSLKEEVISDMAVKTAKKPVKKKASTGKIKKGAKYACSVCGIAVRVDDVCGCTDVCDIICCDTQMRPKK